MEPLSNYPATTAHSHGNNRLKLIFLTIHTAKLDFLIMNFIRNSKIFIIVVSALVFFNAYGLEFERPSWANSSAAEYSAWETFSVGFREPGNTPDIEGSNGGGR